MSEVFCLFDLFLALSHVTLGGPWLEKHPKALFGPLRVAGGAHWRVWVSYFSLINVNFDLIFVDIDVLLNEFLALSLLLVCFVHDTMWVDGLPPEFRALSFWDLEFSACGDDRGPSSTLLFKTTLWWKEVIIRFIFDASCLRTQDLRDPSRPIFGGLSRVVVELKDRDIVLAHIVPNIEHLLMLILIHFRINHQEILHLLLLPWVSSCPLLPYSFRTRLLIAVCLGRVLTAVHPFWAVSLEVSLTACRYWGILSLILLFDHLLLVLDVLFRGLDIFWGHGNFDLLYQGYVVLGFVQTWDPPVLVYLFTEDFVLGLGVVVQTREVLSGHGVY
jgi:hypothetical protein